MAGHTRDPCPGQHEEATLALAATLHLDPDPVRQHPSLVDGLSATAGPRACRGPRLGRGRVAARLRDLLHHPVNEAETGVTLDLCRGPSLLLPVVVVGHLRQHRHRVGEEKLRVRAHHLVEVKGADTPSRCPDLDPVRHRVGHLGGVGVAQQIIFNHSGLQGVGCSS